MWLFQHTVPGAPGIAVMPNTAWHCCATAKAVMSNTAWHYCATAKALWAFHSSELSCQNVTLKGNPESIETQIPQGALMFLKPLTLECLSHLSETPLNSEEIKFQ